MGGGKGGTQSRRQRRGSQSLYGFSGRDKFDRQARPMDWRRRARERPAVWHGRHGARDHLGPSWLESLREGSTDMNEAKNVDPEFERRIMAEVARVSESSQDAKHAEKAHEDAQPRISLVPFEKIKLGTECRYLVKG